MPSSILDKGPWPSVMMRLIAETHGDSWTPVLKRLETHPEEVMVHAGGGATALHNACFRYPPLHAVEAIMRVCPEAAVKQNTEGETPLHLATFGSSEEVQLALLRVAPEAVQKIDQYGDSPLHLAAKSGATLELLHAMVQASPHTISLKNQRGLTPFWLLSRTYKAATHMNDLLPDGEHEEDWQAAKLFLRAACPEEDSVVHAAAKSPGCPREVIAIICKLFPKEQALQRDTSGKTPLALIAETHVMEEPKNWDEAEDGFREDWEMEVLTVEGRPPEDVIRVYSHLERTATTPTQDDDASISLLQMAVQWNPEAARMADNTGRLPLAYAISAGKTWEDGVQQLLWAAPRALETRDTVTHLYPFLLAAVYSPDLDTVYNVLRSLPEHIRQAIPQAPANDLTTSVNNQGTSVTKGREKPSATIKPNNERFKRARCDTGEEMMSVN